MTTYRCTACADAGATCADGAPIPPCILTLDNPLVPPSSCPYGSIAYWHAVADEAPCPIHVHLTVHLDGEAVYRAAGMEPPR